jgi:hypothetical protein
MGAKLASFPFREFSALYAPVHQVRVLSLAGNQLRGLAAPEGGHRASAVMLVAGERILGVSVASSFSEEANSSGIRHGWCGFDLMGLQHALAFGPCGEIRCAATNRSLITLDDKAMTDAKKINLADITVESMRAAIQRDSGIENPEAIWPFAEALFREKGADAFLGACYSFFLDRDIDDSGRSHFSGLIIAGSPLRQVWDTLLTSDEFKGRKQLSFPGPFDPRFPFSLSPLGNQS